MGREVTDAEAATISFVVHRSLGVAYGMTACVLARAGAVPLRAGMWTGAAAFVLVDEAVVSAVFTPPPWAYYPVESHVRGATGHLGYGAATGAMLADARGLGAMRSQCHTPAGFDAKRSAESARDALGARLGMVRERASA